MSDEANERAGSFAEMIAGLAMEEAFYRNSNNSLYLVKRDMGSVNFLQFTANSDNIILNDSAVPDFRALYTFICVFDTVQQENIRKLDAQQSKSRDLGIIADFVIVDLKSGSYTNLAGGGLTDKKLQRVLEKSLQYSHADTSQISEVRKAAVRKAAEGRKASTPAVKLSPASPVMVLLFTNVAIYIAGVILSATRGYDPLMRWGILDGTLVRQGQLWRLFTAMFLHADMAHVFGNMYLLLMLGRVLDGQYSGKRFLFVYFTSGLCGSLLSCTFSHARSLGASGAIMGLGGALVCMLLFDKHKEYLRHGMLYANLAFLVIFNLGYGLFNTGIDNYGHFGGFICGFLLELIFSRRRA